MSTNVKSKKSLCAVAWVPGLPHIRFLDDRQKSYSELREGMIAVGRQFESLSVKRILYFSTQWISVLGQSFQARQDLRGMHVDENWYEMGDLPFQFNVDSAFAAKMAKSSKEAGFVPQLVDYDGFPVDTGTIVADGLLNRRGAQTGMISCHVYADFAATEKLAATIAQTVEEDGVPTAFVIVSALTTNFFTTSIDVREDRLRDETDGPWIDRLLSSFESGNPAKALEVVIGMNAAVKTDMGLKGVALLRGLLGTDQPWSRGHVLAKGPIWGSGNAVTIFS